MRLALLAITAAVATSTAVPAVAAEGRLGPSGARLTGERSGERLCLTLVEPRADLRLRRCLLGARDGVIRSRYVDRTCDFGTRLFGVAPPGAVKVNLGGVLRSGRPIDLRLLRVPERIHPAGGWAFVVRRSLAGTNPTLTAYDAEGRRIAQRVFGPLPIAGCVVTKQPVPAR